MKRQHKKYVIVENPGTIDERLVKGFNTYEAALKFIDKNYTWDDDEVKTDIAKVLDNGDLTYDLWWS